VQDPRQKYFQRLRRLRRSARRWSVAASTLGAATAVLLPYSGVGLPDVFWAAGAGGSTALALWRWSDLRALAAEPAPEPLDPATRARVSQHRLESFVGKLPIGRTAVAELHRVQHLSRLRGSAVASSASRLDIACKTLNGLAPRLQADVLREARAAEAGLRDLAERTASVERGLKMRTSAETSTALTTAHADLCQHFDSGVAAYEGLVAAAASFVAEDARAGDPFAIDRLTEATDRLRGIAAGLAEFTTRTVPMPGL
jgi:hypothetical protein